jgi:hypothetical protein
MELVVILMLLANKSETNIPNSTTTSSKSTTACHGPPPSAPKTVKSHGPRRPKTKPSSTTISELSVKPYDDSLAPGASSSPSAPISIPSLRSAKNHMCRDGWRARSAAGEMILRGIRGRRGMGRCCWSIWIGNIKSRWRRGWIWGLKKR